MNDWFQVQTGDIPSSLLPICVLLCSIAVVHVLSTDAEIAVGGDGWCSKSEDNLSKYLCLFVR